MDLVGTTPTVVPDITLLRLLRLGFGVEQVVAIWPSVPEGSDEHMFQGALARLVEVRPEGVAVSPVRAVTRPADPSSLIGAMSSLTLDPPADAPTPQAQAPPAAITALERPGRPDMASFGDAAVAAHGSLPFQHRTSRVLACPSEPAVSKHGVALIRLRPGSSSSTAGGPAGSSSEVAKEPGHQACEICRAPGGAKLGTVNLEHSMPLFALVQLVADLARVSPLQVLLLSKGIPILAGCLVRDVLPSCCVRLEVMISAPQKGFVLWRSSASTMTGVWIGGPRAYRLIEDILPNRSYSYASGTRLCSVAADESPWEVYRREQARHEAPAVPWVHWALGPPKGSRIHW